MKTIAGIAILCIASLMYTTLRLYADKIELQDAVRTMHFKCGVMDRDDATSVEACQAATLTVRQIANR